MAVRTKKTRVIVALAIVALGSLAFGSLGTSPASGIATSVTIAPKFVGTVVAAAPCEAGRTVVVKKKRRRGKRPRNKIIGTTTSNASGDWSLPSNRQFGRYFAVARAEPRTGTGYGYGSAICEKGKSEKISLGNRRGRRRGPRRGGGGLPPAFPRPG